MCYFPSDKFHGMTIVSDDDCITVKCKDVLEMNSAGECVLRSYDKQMNEVKCIEVNMLAGIKADGKMTESNCTGGIKRQLKRGNYMLISQSVVYKIVSLTHEK